MKTARQIAAEVKAGKLTAVQSVMESLVKIKELNPKLNAFLEVFEEEALARAAQIAVTILGQGHKVTTTRAPTAIAALEGEQTANARWHHGAIPTLVLGLTQ